MRMFLVVSEPASSGILVSGYSFEKLSPEKARAFTGPCSFCGTSADDLFGLAGEVSRSDRVCDECIGLCKEILAEYGIQLSPAAESEAAPNEDLKEILSRIRSNRRLQPGDRRHKFSCSFCDASKESAKKLIAGPNNYICDACVGTASTLFLSAGKTWAPKKAEIDRRFGPIGETELLVMLARCDAATPDRDFIAQARQDMPRLVREVMRLRKLLRDLRGSE